MHQRVITAVPLTGMHEIQIQHFITTSFHHHRVLFHDPSLCHRGNETPIECFQNTRLHDTDCLSAAGGSDYKDVIIQSGFVRIRTEDTILPISKNQSVCFITSIRL